MGAITPRVWVEIKKRRLLNPFREVLKYGNEAVQEWLLMHGINYRIITEEDIRQNRIVPNGINLPIVDLRHEKPPTVELSSLRNEIDSTIGKNSAFSI